MIGSGTENSRSRVLRGRRRIWIRRIRGKRVGESDARSIRKWSVWRRRHVLCLNARGATPTRHGEKFALWRKKGRGKELREEEKDRLKV